MKLTKVKGHATEEEVSRGEATVEDKKGNDFADDVADKWGKLGRWQPDADSRNICTEK